MVTGVGAGYAHDIRAGIEVREYWYPPSVAIKPCNTGLYSARKECTEYHATPTPINVTNYVMQGKYNLYFFDVGV